ncbi:hypothetical protein ZHAS_00001197 [Anopheles sinensis]|uniref:DUF4795 domain-containing protein n=1 Tax=Anopheles sinensis TaxID=74873 RepID=A0A084VB56_ANOSI|nr:hypothetical protein ZHAS_00001197 [Anopheles sinensis]
MESSRTCSELLSEAIGTPEPGALNFTALQQLLQAVLRKLDIENVTIEHIENSPSHNESSTERERDDSQFEKETVEKFEESEAYQLLLARVNELEEVLQGLKGEVLDQKRISSAVLPTIEQLEQFQSGRSSPLHPEHGSALDLLSHTARLDTIDETIGRLTALANDSVLEYSRIEKSLFPYLDGGELAIIRGQLDNINQLLKTHFPGYRSHCSSVSVLRTSRPSNLGDTVPIDFYQYPAPNSIKSRISRRTTIQNQPVPDYGKELDTIRTVLMGLIARLPMSESSDSDTAEAPSNHSLELAANNIRMVWPREIEELFASNDERIEALESSLTKIDKQVESIENRSVSLDETIEQLSLSLESSRKTIDSRLVELEGRLEKKLQNLDERNNREQFETTARINELEHQVENRVDFAHFRTRLGKETFHRTIEELYHRIDNRVEQFTAELKLIWSQFKDSSSEMRGKCGKDELESLETRTRRRLTHLQLLVGNLQRTIRKSVEAAGTKVRLGPDNLRCVSCNHEATMNMLAELIPTGKAVRAVENERERRIKQLNKLVTKITTENARRETTFDVNKLTKKSTKKADMVAPPNLAYKVHKLK